MTNMQMLLAVSSIDAINAIGRDMAETIFNAIASGEKPSGRVLVEVANLSNAIGRDKAEAIFNYLMAC